MEGLLQGIPNVSVYLSDVLITGSPMKSTWKPWRKCLCDWGRLDCDGYVLNASLSGLTKLLRQVSTPVVYTVSPQIQSLAEEQTMDLGCGTRESLSRSQSTVNLSTHIGHGTLRFPERTGIVMWCLALRSGSSPVTLHGRQIRKAHCFCNQVTCSSGETICAIGQRGPSHRVWGEEIQPVPAWTEIHDTFRSQATWASFQQNQLLLVSNVGLSYS